MYATLDMKLEGRPGKHALKLKLDTGAEGNILPIKTYRQMYPQNIDRDGNPCEGTLLPSSSSLTAYNHTPIHCLGTTTIDCRHNDKWVKTTFFVVDVIGPVILGLDSCRFLKLLTFNCAINNNKSTLNNIQDLKQEYPDQFDHIGEFSTTHTSLSLTPTFRVTSTHRGKHR